MHYIIATYRNKHAAYRLFCINVLLCLFMHSEITAMDEQEKQQRIDALDKYAYDITQQLVPVIDGLVLKLKQVITEVEYSNISSTSNPMKKVELLMKSIRARLLTFDAFCNALEELKHDNLAQSLRCMFHQ